MAKIEVTPITSGYNVAALNETLQNIEDEFKNKVVYRDEVAPMERSLDMNGENILNTDTLTVNRIQLGSAVLVEETISELNAALDEVDQSASNAASSAASALSSENTASSAALSASLSAQAANEVAQFLDGNPALDSSQIAFQQPGGVARTVESKLREMWDYVTGLLGSTGGTAEAQTALGATATGASLFTTASAAAARTTLGLPDSGPLSGLRNLIINGNFAINQRGYVSGTATSSANQYTLDHWRVVISGQSLTFTASGNGNLVTAPAGGIEQVIEGVSIAGGTYVINWTGTATCTVGGTARTKGTTFTLAAGTNATVRFSGGTVGEVQVEPGSVVTAFEARPYGLELMLCQRYYEQVSGYDGGYMGISSASVRTAPACFKVRKRIVPSVVVSSIAYSNASGMVMEIIGPDYVASYINANMGMYSVNYTLQLNAEL